MHKQDLKKLAQRFGKLPLPTPKRAPLYVALMRAIAHQQLHGKSAATILARFVALYNNKFPTPAQVLATRAPTLRKVGFSASKVAAIKDIAKFAQAKKIPSHAATQKMSNEAIIAALTPIKGVGRWTVEMLLIFHLGRADVWPVDDFGVREGFKIWHQLPAQPKPKELEKLGEAYAPNRTLAALYYWRVADVAKLERKQK